MTENTVRRVGEAADALEEQLRPLGWIVSQQGLRDLPEGTVVVSPTGVAERLDGDSWIVTGSSQPLASHELALPCQVLNAIRHTAIVEFGIPHNGKPVAPDSDS